MAGAPAVDSGRRRGFGLAVIAVLLVAIQLYSFVLLARIVFSWIPITPGSALEGVYGVVHALTEPPLAAIRSVVPPIRAGMGALDLSPLILLLGLQLLAALIAR